MPPHKYFTLEDTQKVLELMEDRRFRYAAVVDLKDAYLHIKLHPTLQNFLGCEIEDGGRKRYFRWKTMCFGLGHAPS